MPRVSNSLKDYGVLEVECKRKSDSENDFLLGVLDFLNNQQWFYFLLTGTVHSRQATQLALQVCDAWQN